MNAFPKSLKKFFPQIIYLICVSGFFLMCAFLYEPKGLRVLMLSGEGIRGIKNIFSFNVSIVFAIIFTSMAILRLVYFFLRDRIGVNWFWYVIWCLFEVLILSAFVALYLTLMAPPESNYFSFFGRSIGSLSSLLVYPYLIVTLGYAYKDASEPSLYDEGARLRFYDHRHLLKFITTASSVLYIKADENYIEVHYLENDTEKKYQIRNTMKNMEPLCEKAGFVRSHRSYFVNPSHIRLVKKDEMGAFQAELDCASDVLIPVSKKYYAALTASL